MTSWIIIRSFLIQNIVYLKYLLIGLFICFVYFKGMEREKIRYEDILKDRTIEQQKKINEFNKAIDDKAAQSQNLAQTLENQAYEHKKEIDDLHDKLSKHNGMQRKQVCGQSKPNTSSKNSGSSLSIKQQAVDSWLSREFEEFLISSAKRADEAGLYAEIAQEWIKELCKNDNFICVKEANNATRTKK